MAEFTANTDSPKRADPSVHAPKRVTDCRDSGGGVGGFPRLDGPQGGNPEPPQRRGRVPREGVARPGTLNDGAAIMLVCYHVANVNMLLALYRGIVRKDRTIPRGEGAGEAAHHRQPPTCPRRGRRMAAKSTAAEPIYAHVRAAPLARRGDIRQAAEHAHSTPEAVKRRRDDEIGFRCIATVPVRDGPVAARWRTARVFPHGHKKSMDGGLPPLLDYPALYDSHLKAHGDAKRPPRGHAGMHLIVGISPSYFEGRGSMHDPENPNVRKLLAAAAEWAESEIGGVWAARYDLDEKGGAVVDVFASPIHTNLRTGKMAVSCRKAKDRLQRKYKTPRSYSAMQDSWRDFASRRLGFEFKRGQPKQETQREHVHADTFADAMEQGKARMAQMEREMRELQKRIDAARKTLRKLARAAKRARTALTNWIVTNLRTRDRPVMAGEDNDDLVSQAVGVASHMAHVEDPDKTQQEHWKGLVSHIDKATRGAWDRDGGTDEPLVRAYRAYRSRTKDSPPKQYDEWLSDMAHGSMRGMSADQRDLVRLARGIAKAEGWYQPRSKRKVAKDR